MPDICIIVYHTENDLPLVAREYQANKLMKKNTQHNLVLSITELPHTQSEFFAVKVNHSSFSNPADPCLRNTSHSPCPGHLFLPTAFYQFLIRSKNS